jgi:hypothetical protein
MFCINTSDSKITCMDVNAHARAGHGYDRQYTSAYWSCQMAVEFMT